MVSESVKLDDIDPNQPTERIHQIIRDEHLKDSTVTVVLVGANTWQRKYVDWEINSSIRQTKNNPRSGLLGILLPTYPRPIGNLKNYYIHTIPPRLYKNIKWAGTVVVYVSEDTWKSEWVNWEIEQAHRLGKRIVGVWKYGEKDCKIPEALEKYGDAMAGWNSESIIDALIGTSEVWYKQNGESRDYQKISRYGC